MVFGSSQIRFLRRPSDAPLFARTKASIKAVQKWRYSPVLINGDPVDVDTTIAVMFSLNY